MRLLLDTNAFLWWREGSSRLPARIEQEIGDPDNDIAVSVVSVWEIAIKRALGKLHFDQDFEAVLAEEEFSLLQVGYAHLRVLAELPRHHDDPFDRMLIAQSVAERLPIISADRTFALYHIETHW
jgi:PIN domain nuclease of toxin-antitoxin system